ncbi:MAG TPA: AAA domain-containing protein [Desulfitobacterium dehalogenans]|uniref:AAA domain-containing protein n=1 Tax=Desulfitobacterium dehalogenans TaxID=36854 RepID=A0A7C7D7P1_9FIRM|nr:AAA domain-containing protein [Desulfitobacterium dehalogenans]
MDQWLLSPGRRLSEEEQTLVWCKPSSHKDSEEEIRICNEIKRNWNQGEMKIANILLEGDAGSGKTQLAKALSANFGLPYTKVTCFADMDKSDIIGAILPVLSDELQESMGSEEKETLKALYQSDNLSAAVGILVKTLGITEKQAGVRIRQMVKVLEQLPQTENVKYRFYPSEIVRAFRNGYLLEIQEPTVIRDAAMLMALNSALEPDGIINLPTEIIHRHPDFITVITTNRGYNGCRPLNEALRDRIQHAERMDMPSIEVMIERAIAKTGYSDRYVLSVLANAIFVLDQTARANAIKGVAGMRSYFYWIDAVAYGADVKESLYHKVMYKITTDPDEIRILEEALEAYGIASELNDINSNRHVKKNMIPTS